jgi:uncharacterized protein YjbI with pentapeptide repeats
MVALPLMPPPAHATDLNVLVRLLETKQCQNCNLRDADLVQADLRDADLRGAQLQRANLSRAQLDGARLGGVDLSFTSLLGASLRGADLRGARLEGTDLRDADLSGAQFDAGALASTHWRGAIGINPAFQSYAELHNAGVAAAQRDKFPEAEQFFSDAIRKRPEAAISWVARGIVRSEQGKNELAAKDFGYAAALYQQEGEVAFSSQLTDASKKLVASPNKPPGGNNIGSQMVSGALSAIQFLAPLAAKALVAF